MSGFRRLMSSHYVRLPSSFARDSGQHKLIGRMLVASRILLYVYNVYSKVCATLLFILDISGY